MKRARRNKIAEWGRPIALFLIGAAVFFALFASTAPEPVRADPGWWNTSWTNRRLITITGIHPENYQIRVVIPYSPNMQTDYDDLRFVENDTTGVLNYWIENYTADNVTVWVRRLENTQYDIDNTIYVYYGNPDATSMSSGDNTFITFNTTGTMWTVSGTSGQDTTFGKDDSQSFKAVGDGTTNWRGGIWPYGFSTSRRFIIEYWIYLDHFTANVQHRLLSCTNSSAYPLSGVGHNTQAVDGYFKYIEGGTMTSTGVAASATTWYELRTVPNPATSKFDWYYRTDGGEWTTLGTDLGLEAAYSNPYYLDFDVYNTTDNMHVDVLRVRTFTDLEPTTTIGADESLNIIISNIACDNVLIDRDIDWVDSKAPTGTKLRVDVEWTLPNNVVKENVRFIVYDKNNVLIDNRVATENLRIADNKQTFFEVYRATDNTLSDTQLGEWDVGVTANDNEGVKGSTRATNVFQVSDLTATCTVENVPKHRLRVYGTGSRVDGATVIIENIWLEDNNVGTRHQALANNGYDDTYAPLGAGNLHIRLKSKNLDGRHPLGGDNISYLYPNFAPEVVSMTVSEALVDRARNYSGSNVVLSTIMTVRVRDVDNRDDINTLRIGIRDNAEALVENVDRWENRTVIDENTYEVGFIYDPLETISNLGTFDVWRHATDRHGGVLSSWAEGFVVDDLAISISFDPIRPYCQWPLTVSGTISRVSKIVASVDNSWLIENKHGTFTLGASNTYGITYSITNVQPNENIAVTLRALDSPLDGVLHSNYVTNENLLYEIWVRWDNEWALEDNIIRRSRIIKFYWDGGTYSKTLTENPENIIMAAAGKAATWVQLKDTDAYWRGRVPAENGGRLAFFIARDNNMPKKYEFVLEDHTNMFGPPNTADGQLRIRAWLDNNFAELSDDHWDAFLKSYAFLQKGERYYVYIYRPGEQRSWGMFQTEETTVNTLKVYPIVFGVEPLRISDVIILGAERDVDTGNIKISYQDKAENTENIIFSVYTFAEDNLLYTTFADYTPAYSTTWTQADNNRSYKVAIVAKNKIFGDILHTQTIGTNIPAPVLPSIAEDGGSPFDLPLPLATFGALMITLVIGLSFSAVHAGLAAIAMIFVAALFIYLGWFPLSMGAVLGVMLVIVVIWKLTSGR